MGRGSRIVWAGDYADPEPIEVDSEKPNLYSIADSMDPSSKFDPSLPNAATFDFLSETFLINHDKKEFVIVNKAIDEGPHPLVLLTAEGCGRGGGDHPVDHEFIGRWARDLISVDHLFFQAPEGYVQLLVDFEY
jgi:hypothetical protein